MAFDNRGNKELLLAAAFGVFIGCGGLIFLSSSIELAKSEKGPKWLVGILKKQEDAGVERRVELKTRQILDNECQGYFVKLRDRNGDGAYDVKNVAHSGELAEIHEDINFDGFFETETILEDSMRVWSEIDTDNDELFDMEVLYVNDVPSVVVFKDGDSGQPLKVKKIFMGKTVEANVDLDRDGELDTAYSYDDIEEIVSIYPLNENPERAIEY